MLTCDCDYDPEPGDTVWWAPADFSVYAGSRRVRCCSCGCMVSPGETCAEFHRFKIACSVVEEKIYGESGEIPRASHYMCERCAGLYFSLSDLGFCVGVSDDMRALVKEYAQMQAEGRRIYNPWQTEAGANDG
jgi:hypothetical protein